MVDWNIFLLLQRCRCCYIRTSGTEVDPNAADFCSVAEESIAQSSVFLLSDVLAGLGRIISGSRPHRLSQRIHSQVGKTIFYRQLKSSP